MRLRGPPHKRIAVLRRYLPLYPRPRARSAFPGTPRPCTYSSRGRTVSVARAICNGPCAWRSSCCWCTTVGGTDARPIRRRRPVRKRRRDATSPLSGSSRSACTTRRRRESTKVSVPSTRFHNLDDYLFIRISLSGTLESRSFFFFARSKFWSAKI